MDTAIENKLKGAVTSLEGLVGRKLMAVEQRGDDELIFHLSPDNYIKLYHQQDCCETVYIEDICGDLEDLVDSEILMAEESTGEPPHGRELDSWESETWTFYRFQSRKGCVDIRWCGSSNGYYSERVDLEVMVDGKIDYGWRY